MEITRKIEWDMGHRVPNHKNKCRNPHGHRYVLEVTLRGDINTHKGSSSEGMVLDFGDLKQLMMINIHSKLDHKFMIYEKDSWLADMASKNSEDLGFIIVPFIPTAENIVVWCSEQLANKVQAPLRLHHLRLYETPNAWTDYSPF